MYWHKTMRPNVMLILLTKMTIRSNIAKSTTDPRVEFISQVPKKSWSNFNWALTLKSQPNINISTKLKLKILTKLSFMILTKIQLCHLNQNQQQNTDQSSASKSCLIYNFKLLTKPCAESLNKSLAFRPNLSFQIFIINISKSNNPTSFEKASSHARVTSIKFTKRQLVS